jgi:hypothetical protein
MAKWEEQFKKDLKKLFDTYGIVMVLNMDAGYYEGKFFVNAYHVYFYKSNPNDEKDAEELIRRMLIDDALDRGDREEFLRLTSGGSVISGEDEFKSDETKSCADCGIQLYGDKLKCKTCGSPLCTDCYHDSRGRCHRCEKYFKFTGEI